MTAMVENKGNIARIILSGKLDYLTCNDILIAIDQALAVNEAREIQVDLSDVIFLDSSVIQALLLLQEKANTERKSVILLHCRETIREIFTIGGFDHIFKIQ